MEYGLAGKTVWVDLTEKEIKYEPSGNYRDFLGGRALGSYIVFKEVPAETCPLGEKNIITFNTGPLTGTLAPSAGRLGISTKSVSTKGICFTNDGGHFAPEMKYAGFDHLFVKGKADKPVYLL